MPQMDVIILTSQVNFFFIFWLGYFVFIKTLLPVICIELKIKKKILISFGKWFKNNMSSVVFFRKPHTKLLIKTQNMLDICNIFFKKKNVFFGIYKTDLFFIKDKLLNSK